MADLWNTPVNPDVDPLAGLEVPDNLEEIVDNILNNPEYQKERERRIAPYRTKVTRKTLDKWVL